MFDRLRDYFRGLGRRQMVRPWALSAPVVILLIAAPLLRPLRSPGDVSENELSRLATVQSLVENNSLEIDRSSSFASLKRLDRQYSPIRSDSAIPAGAIRVNGRHYSDKPPVLAFLLSWPYAILNAAGVDLGNNPALVAYILTMLGVTLPVAAAAGILYRMARVFELRRPWRALLALAVVMGSGLFSYATALNSHAPAAALLLASCACLLHLINSRNPRNSGARLTLCGFCTALAAAIDLSATIFLLLFIPVIIAMRWNGGLKLSGVLLYIAGAVPPVFLHAVLTVPVTGDLRPGFLHDEYRSSYARDLYYDDWDEPGPTWKARSAELLIRGMGSLVGSKGLLSHFPVTVLGVAGLLLVLRMHWPRSTKMMAGMLLLGMIIIIATYVIGGDWGQAMFGPRWFIIFMPAVLFWAGAWARRPHHRVTWGVAIALLCISGLISMLGAAVPFVKAAPGEYTVTAALDQFKKSGRPAPNRRSLDSIANR